MKIRKAKKSDYKQLMQLYDSFLETSRYSKQGHDSFKQVMSSLKNVVYVAEEKGRLVGFITFLARYVVRYPHPIGQIEEMFVLKKFRGKGVGKSLVDRIETAARKLKCSRIYVESGYEHHPAHTFYETLGYKKSGHYFLKND